MQPEKKIKALPHRGVISKSRARTEAPQCFVHFLSLSLFSNSSLLLLQSIGVGVSIGERLKPKGDQKEGKDDIGGISHPSGLAKKSWQVTNMEETPSCRHDLLS